MPDNNKIITTASVQENPRIPPSAIADLKPFSVNQRDQEVDRYWESEDMPPGRRRSSFPTEYPPLDSLIKKTGHIALIVKDINKPNKVTAKWVSYSPEKPPSLNENSRCFVLSKQFYNGIIAILDLGTTSYLIHGLESVKQVKTSSNFLVALLGKDNAGNYSVYLQNAFAGLIEQDPGGDFGTSPGGEGAGGVKLPRN